MRTLAEECFNTLQNDIVEGRLAPGARLTMDALREHLGVGLSPIREALVKLRHAGLVTLEGHKGFSVRAIEENEVRDLYQTVCAIETLALRQACKHGDVEWEANIARTLHHLKRLETGDQPIPYPQWSPANHAFHRALVAGCGSPHLLEIRDQLWVQFERYIRLAFTLNKAPLIANHQKHRDLANALLERDADCAVGMVEQHILGSIDEVIACFQKGGLL